MNASAKFEAGSALHDLDTSVISTEYSDASLSSCRHSLLCGGMSFPPTPAESTVEAEGGVEQPTPRATDVGATLRQREERPRKVVDRGGRKSSGSSSQGGGLAATVKNSSAFEDVVSIDGLREIRRSSLNRTLTVKERVQKMQNEIEKVDLQRKRSSSRIGLESSDPGAQRSLKLSASATDLRSAKGVLRRWNLPVATAEQQVGPVKAACARGAVRSASEANLSASVCDVVAKEGESKGEGEHPTRIKELSVTCSALSRQLATSRFDHEASVDDLRRAHVSELQRLEQKHLGLTMQRDAELKTARKELHRVRSEARLQIAKARASCQRELADALGTATSLCSAISNARLQASKGGG